MAPLLEGRVRKPSSWIAGIVCRFDLCSFFFFFLNLVLLIELFLRDCAALILYFNTRKTRTRTGGFRSNSRILASEQDSSPSKKPKEFSPMPTACSSRDQEQEKPSFCEAAKTRKSEFDHFPGCDVTNDRFEILEEFSSLGIDDIVSLLQLANCKGRNVNITADDRRETNSLSPDEGKFLSACII